MTDDATIRKRLFAMLHTRTRALRPGDTIAEPLTPTSVFHLPDEPAPDRVYGRIGNPTVKAVEERLAALEDAPVALFSSGMAAYAAAVLATVKAGDTVLLLSDGYYAVRNLMDEVLTGFGRHGGHLPDRRDRHGAARRCQARYRRNSDQPASGRHRSRGTVRTLPGGRLVAGGGQHRVHGADPAAARSRRRPGDRLRHQIGLRPFRPAARPCRVARRGSDGKGRPGPHAGRRHRQPVRCVAAATRPRDAGAAAGTHGRDRRQGSPRC